MAENECPKLRRLGLHEAKRGGQAFVALVCPFGLFPEPILIAREWFSLVVRHFDGRNSLTSIQAQVLRETAQLLPLENLRGLVEQLDRALAIESPTFDAFLDEYRRDRIRPAAHAGGTYPASDRALRAQLGRFFVDPAGAGLPPGCRPSEVEPSGSPSQVGVLRGILSPHIDFRRGGPTYTWAYRELIEKSDANVFVIFGVAHAPCRRRFALTRKDFRTPLGLARTDQSFVDRIALRLGDEAFEDELAHRREHSIEFQIVFLQYLLGESRDFSVVPILVGSFHDLAARGIDPIDDPEVARLLVAVREAESAQAGRVAYIGGVDLCHVGPEFGDPKPIDEAISDRVRAFDSSILGHLESPDPAAWFAVAGQGIGNGEGDRWRVCGLSATYSMLHAMGPATGRILRYDQAVDTGRNSLVSFASLAFEVAVPVSPTHTEE